MKTTYYCNSKINSRILFPVLFLLLTFLISPVLSGQAGREKVAPLVTSEWLNGNLTNSEIVVLHVSAVRADYENNHIPGARFLWPGYVSVSTELQSTIPAETADLKKTLQGLGVSTGSHIILCGISGNLVQVCRIFVTLEKIGFRGRVSVLDGGFEEWKKAGHLVSVESPLVKKGKISTSPYENLVDAQWMVKNLENNSYRIIDARAKAQYDGTPDGVRSGHIKGAKNIPPTELFDSKTYLFLPVEKLKENFAKLNIGSGLRPVFYCNSGNSASVAYVGAVILGYEPLVYDGSMEEWAARQELPMEKVDLK
jgi:thiosulfate/3-mercaptopyruvate sulfurtransferase